MGPPELRDLRRFPAIESISAGERLQNPGVDGEGFQPARPEEEHAVGHFLADAGQ